MLWAVLALLAGLPLLIWSADRFVDGAAATARWHGVSPLVIGMVIIGFGTSAPEIVVSILASSQGNPGVALGNAIGSNISNILLVIGATALIKVIRIRSGLVRREFPVLIAATALCTLLLLDRLLSRTDGAVLLLLFALLISWTIRETLQHRRDALSRELVQEARDEPHISRQKAATWLAIGLILLVASSRVLVWGAVTLAEILGVPDLVIGLTVIAIGTSLPELAASISAVRKGENDMALGNIVGSNLFNTLAVIGLAGLIQPLSLDRLVLLRDLPTMMIATLLLYLVCFRAPREGHITRAAGGMLIASWLLYNAVLLITTVQGAIPHGAA